MTKEFSLDWKFTFGKYKGLPIDSVLKFNPRYIQWVRNKFDWFVLDTTAQEKYKRKIAKWDNMTYNQQIAWSYGYGKEGEQLIH